MHKLQSVSLKVYLNNNYPVFCVHDVVPGVRRIFIDTINQLTDVVCNYSGHFRSCFCLVQEIDFRFVRLN